MTTTTTFDFTLAFTTRTIRCPVCGSTATREIQAGRIGVDVIEVTCSSIDCVWKQRVQRESKTGLCMALGPIRVSSGAAKGSAWLMPVSSKPRPCAVPHCSQRATATGFCHEHNITNRRPRNARGGIA